jgi:hypothetical protein
MFIGHVALGFAAKKVAPRASLGTTVAAAMFLDVLWPLFLLLGIETVRIAPGDTAFTPFDFVSYPWSHSLAMAAVWSVAFGGAYHAFRRDALTARILGCLVLSHWVLDWVTHRPDLPLAPWSSFKTGLSLWSSVPATLAVEGSLFIAGVVLYARATAPLDRIGRWGFWVFVAFLILIYASELGPPPKPGQEAVIPWLTLALGVLFPWAAWFDRHRVLLG